MSPDPDPATAGSMVVVSVEEAARRATPAGAAFSEVTGLQRLGFLMFMTLLLAVAVLFAVLVVFAWLTHPVLEEVNALVPSDGDKLAAWNAAQLEWRTSVKDLGTTFLVTPVLPLLGIVIGYIFGERSNSGEASGEA